MAKNEPTFWSDHFGSCKINSESDFRNERLSFVGRFVNWIDSHRGPLDGRGRQTLGEGGVHSSGQGHVEFLAAFVVEKMRKRRKSGNNFCVISYFILTEHRSFGSVRSRSILAPINDLKWAIPDLFFFIFVFSIQLKVNVQSKLLPMTGFELQNSEIGGYRSTNWATTTISGFDAYFCYVPSRSIFDRKAFGVTGARTPCISHD